MAEEEKKEEQEETPEKVSPQEKKKIEAQEMIDKTNEAAGRLEAANRRFQELLDENAKAKLEKTFDGQADAGEGKKEDSDKAYMEKVMRGEVPK